MAAMEAAQPRADVREPAQPIHVTGTWTSEDGTEVHVSGDVLPDDPAYQLLHDDSLQVSMAGADEELPIVVQAQRGMLSKKDLAALRRLAGDLTLAEWMVEPPERRKPWRLKEPNAILRCMLLTGSRAQAQDMARLAAWLLVPAVRS
jgi:hypothetical protein